MRFRYFLNAPAIDFPINDRDNDVSMWKASLVLHHCDSLWDGCDAVSVILADNTCL